MVNYISGLVFVVLFLVGAAITLAIGNRGRRPSRSFSASRGCSTRLRLIGDPASRPAGKGGVFALAIPLDEGARVIHIIPLVTSPGWSTHVCSR